MAVGTRILRYLGLCVALLPFGTIATARTIHVAPSGGDYDSLSVALFAAVDGDSVVIAHGVYVEDWHRPEVVLVERKQLTVLGDSDTPEAVTVTGFRIWFRSCDGTRVEGIRFFRNPGPLVFAGGSASVTNCVFEENEGRYQCGAVSFGGALGSDVLISNCSFIRNVGQNPLCDAGGISAGSGRAVVEDCLFYGNRTPGMGGAIYSEAFTEIRRCTFLSNRAANGAAVAHLYGRFSMEQCTLWNNVVTGTGAALYTRTDQWSLTRSIIAGTRRGSGVLCDDYGPVECSDFWDNEAGVGCQALASEGNVFEDPMFCDEAVGDVGLRAGSPCLREEQNGVACGPIGAFGAECGVTPVEPMTWGRIKSSYVSPAQDVK